MVKIIWLPSSRMRLNCQINPGAMTTGNKKRVARTLAVMMFRDRRLKRAADQAMIRYHILKLLSHSGLVAGKKVEVA